MFIFQYQNLLGEKIKKLDQVPLISSSYSFIIYAVGVWAHGSVLNFWFGLSSKNLSIALLSDHL